MGTNQNTLNSILIVLTMKVAKHWHRLARKVVESPHMQTVKTQLDTGPGKLLSLAQLERGGLD